MTDTVCFMQRKTFGVVFGILSVFFSIYPTPGLIKSLIEIDEIAKSDVAVGVEMAKPNVILEIESLVLKVSVAYNLLNIFVSFVLVGGALKESHAFLVPWLVINGLLLVVGSIGLIYVLPKLNADFLPRILYSMILLAIQRYFFCNILSLFREFKDASKSRKKLIEKEALFRA